MKWACNADSRRTDKYHSIACAAISVALSFYSGHSSAQISDGDLIVLPGDGVETIDSKEIISGGAVVGINFFDHADKRDPDAIFVYFDAQPCGNLLAQLTTVDGRYNFKAGISLTEGADLTDKWGRLRLTKEKGKPLNAGFLQKYTEVNEVAVLVTDSSSPRRSFPVRWGSESATKTVRIRVNAEGADAYMIRLEDKDNSIGNDGESDKRAKLVRCDKASADSRFKFDHNCDMRWEDIIEISQTNKIQIIRKRGATYESPIVLNMTASITDTTNTHQTCGQEK